MVILRRSKSAGGRRQRNPDARSDESKEKAAKEARRRNRVDSCCWFVGCLSSVWWFVLFLCSLMPASLPQYMTEVITGPFPDPPGVKLAEDGLKVKHPVVFIPGIVTGGLELWQGHSCAEGLFRTKLWGGTFGDAYKRPLCWVEHMSLDNETGLDPPGIKIRSVSGLIAADYFAPGYFVWAVLIANLARIGYEDKNMLMAAYDWRLSFQNTEVRDQTLSRLKSNIELMVATSGGKKVVVVPHSMGALYSLHFMKWVEAPAPMGGGGGPSWCANHIKAVMNIAGPFLGLPKMVTGLLSAEAKDIAIARGVAPNILDKDVLGFQTLQHMLQMTRTWDSTMSMLLKGGDTIWGGLDWSPEEGHVCSSKKEGDAQTSGHNKTPNFTNSSRVNYGRLISFGKDVADMHSSEIESADFRGAFKGETLAYTTCRDVWTEYRDVWTEYHDMGIGGIKAVADYKVFTANSLLDLLYFVAPKMMKRGGAYYSYGIADNLSDKKYDHYKFWSNPLETELPNAPDMEIFSMYGVGIPTERAYIYKLSPNSDCSIPFQIDNSANGGAEDHCLKGGVYSMDGDGTVPVLSAGFMFAKGWRGDGTVPVLSAGFMFAKGWRGKTRFNPSGIRTYIREYSHAPPANILDGRGTQSGAHVNILGNFALIEDIIRVAAGATGEDLGGDRVHSDIFKWSDRIELKL